MLYLHDRYVALKLYLSLPPLFISRIYPVSMCIDIIRIIDITFMYMKKSRNDRDKDWIKMCTYF